MGDPPSSFGGSQFNMHESGVISDTARFLGGLGLSTTMKWMLTLSDPASFSS